MGNLSDAMILDFTAAKRTEWEAIDDRIMGGSSQSTPEYMEGVGLRFSGKVSLENNGGFASIRSEDTELDLSPYSGIRVRLRGDGKKYKLSLRTDSFYDGVSYLAEFATIADTWQEIDLPFDAFLPTHHGIKLTTVSPIDTSSIKSFGLFISGKQEGSFRLEIAWLKGL